jgi:hypothetical protein
MPAKLKPCPDCGHEVSRNATACPHCGRGLIPKELIIAAVLLIAVIYFALSHLPYVAAAIYQLMPCQMTRALVTE